MIDGVPKETTLIRLWSRTFRNSLMSSFQRNDWGCLGDYGRLPHGGESPG